MASYVRPHELDDALDALRRGPKALLAGGTDFYPARVAKPLDDEILDISAIDALRGIEEQSDRYRIGALVTWSQLIRTPLPAMFDGYKLAAREVGGAQIQNAGTLCGNLCNASPAADGTPNLLALGARVELSSRNGVRELDVADFVVGNRRTRLREDELVTALIVPKPTREARSHFLKLGARRYLVISIIMVAVVIEADSRGAIASARISVGSCGTTASRLTALELALNGRPAGEPLGHHVRAAHLSSLTPIDDVRGTAAYRQDAALTLIRRALDETAAQHAIPARA